MKGGQFAYSLFTCHRRRDAAYTVNPHRRLNSSASHLCEHVRMPTCDCAVEISRLPAIYEKNVELILWF